MSPIIRPCVLLLFALAAVLPSTRGECDDDAVVIEDRPRAVAPPDRRPPEPLPPELEQIRESQGGSIVGRFAPQLFEPTPAQRPEGFQPRTDRPEGGPPRWRDAPPAGPRDAQRRPVDLLRDSAWHMDGVAQRLEIAELYDQADSVRQLAQQLRLTARKLAGSPEKPGRQPHPTRNE